MQQGHWWDNILWVLIFLFVVPSSLVVASWNSLPGSRLYAVKLFAEDIIVSLTPSKGAKSELQVAYADKRLSDATQLLSQSESADGLEYFRKQMEDAKVALAQAPDGSAKEELKAKYLAALENASHQLEQQKQIISTAHNILTETPQPQQKIISTGKPREIVVVKEVTKVNYVTQVNQVTQVTHVTQVIKQIDQTQNQISEIIKQVQQTPQYSPPVPTAIPTAIPNAAQPTQTPVEIPEQPMQQNPAPMQGFGTVQNNSGKGSNGVQKSEEQTDPKKNDDSNQDSGNNTQ